MSSATPTSALGLGRSLSSPALHLLTAQLNSPVVPSNVAAPASKTTRAPLSAASTDSPRSNQAQLASSSSSSSSAAASGSLSRSRSSRRRQSLSAGHHLSGGQDGGGPSSLATMKKSPLSSVDQRNKPYHRQQNDNPITGQPSPRTHGSGPRLAGSGEQRYRSVGMGGTGSTSSGGSVDEFGVRSFDGRTPTLSLNGSTSQRSTSSLGDSEYHSSQGGFPAVGLGVIGLDLGAAGDESEDTECGRPSYQLEDVLETGYESDGDSYGNTVSPHGKDVQTGALLSPFLPSNQSSAAASPVADLSDSTYYNPSSYASHTNPSPQAYQHHPQASHQHPNQYQAPSGSYPAHPHGMPPSHPTTFAYPPGPTPTFYHSHPEPTSHGYLSYPSYHEGASFSTDAYGGNSYPGLASSSSSHSLHSFPSHPAYPPIISPNDSYASLSGARPHGYIQSPPRMTAIPTSLVLPPPPKPVQLPTPAAASSSSPTTQTIVAAPVASSAVSVSRPKTLQRTASDPDARGTHSVRLPSAVAKEKAEMHKAAKQAERGPSKASAKSKLTNEDKLEIILSHDNDPTLTQQDSATKYGVDRSTISKITNNRARWLNAELSPVVKRDPVDSTKNTDSKSLRGRFVRAETQTNEWLDEQYRKGHYPEDMAIRDQAVIFHNQDRGFYDKEFKGSSKWLNSFKDRRRMAKIWLSSPEAALNPPLTAPPVQKATAPTPSAAKPTPILAPTPTRPADLIRMHERQSYQDAPPMTATSSTSSFGASSSSGGSSLFSPQGLLSSFSSRGSSPRAQTTSVPLSRTVSGDHQGGNEYAHSTSLPTAPFSSLRVRSQSSPDIHTPQGNQSTNHQGTPTLQSAGRRPSSGKVAKARPAALNRGTSFTTLASLRASISPGSSRPHSPRSAGLSRSATCRSPSSAPSSSSGSSSYSGRKSLGPGFDFTPLEPRTVRMRSSTQVSNDSQYSVDQLNETADKPPYLDAPSYQQQFARVDDLQHQHQHQGYQAYANDGRPTTSELGAFASNLGEMSIHSNPMSRESSSHHQMAAPEPYPMMQHQQVYHPNPNTNYHPVEPDNVSPTALYYPAPLPQTDAYGYRYPSYGVAGQDTAGGYAAATAAYYPQQQQPFYGQLSQEGTGYAYAAQPQEGYAYETEGEQGTWGT